MPGSPAHLARRFFDVASARPLTADERTKVGEWLADSLLEIFLAQPDHDQRHGYEAGLAVLAAGFDDRDVLTAALMHDVGKRHARLGLFGRSLASILILLGVTLPARFAVYRDHGLIAARELGELGAPSLVIDFALHHHGERPPTIPEDVWEALAAADQPAKTSRRGGGDITSTVT